MKYIFRKVDIKECVCTGQAGDILCTVHNSLHIVAKRIKIFELKNYSLESKKEKKK